MVISAEAVPNGIPISIQTSFTINGVPKWTTYAESLAADRYNFVFPTQITYEGETYDLLGTNEFYIDHPQNAETYFKASYFKELPPPVPPSEWPFIRDVHVFDDVTLKAEAHQNWNEKVANVKVNTDNLLGGKISYYIKYERGNDLPVKARIILNENMVFEDTFSNGESKTGEIDITGSILENNVIEIYHRSAIALWSEFTFDIWLQLGYSEEPKLPCPFPILFKNLRGQQAPLLCELWKRISGEGSKT